MKAVASKVSEKNDTLLLPAVDLEDSGPYEIAEPRVITALETYTPSCKHSHPPPIRCANFHRRPLPIQFGSFSTDLIDTGMFRG